MAGSSARRTIPAIVFILLLSMISGLVWWRVLHRDTTPAKHVAITPPSSTHCVTVTSKPVSWPAPSSITVSVLNATNKTGLAASVTTVLRQRGFKALKPSDDVKTSAATEVRYAARYRTAARLVQLYVPGAKLVTTPSTSATIVVAVGSTFKALATPQQVTAAKMKATAVRTC